VRSVWFLGTFCRLSTVASLAWAAPDTLAAGAADQLAQKPTVSEDREGSSDASITAPRPIWTSVNTPSEPTTRVTVLLELIVNERGRVDAIQLLEGPEPFATAALEAAPNFTFEPAKVRGQPAAAKIRFLVRFEPKVPVAVPATKSTPSTSSAKSPKHSEAAGSGAIEVVVTAMRPAYTQGVVTRAEAREIPGTFGDPLRAIESSAGVTPIFSGVPFFFVRGAPPGNVGFYLDGVRVPLLYHAILGPSVVHPGLIDHVELHRGAPPAQYGRYAGAIVDAQTRTPLSRAGGEGNVRIFDAGALVETPFADGRGHALVGGRYSYTGLIVSMLSAADVAYWDYQTRVDYATTRNSKIGIFAFGAYDRAAASDGTVERGGGLQFHRVDLRYDIDQARSTTRIAITTGFDRTGSPSGTLSGKNVAFRSLTEQRVLKNFSLIYGSDVTVDNYALRIDQATAEAPDLLKLFPDRTDVQGSVFAQVQYAPTEWVTLAPGIRADSYRIAGATATAFDPRFSATFHPNRRIYTSYSLGVSNQPPNFIPQVPAASVGTLNGGLQRSLSMSTTVGAQLPLDFHGSITGFRAEYYNLLDPIGRDKDWSFDPNSLSHRERGTAYGIELEFRRTMTRRIGGFLSATFSHSERSSGARESLSAFDRPLVLAAALGVDLGYRIRFGARVGYYSGIPGRVFNGSVATFDGSLRSRPFYRADLRLERRWPIAGRGYWALVAEMLNATMSQEITSRNCGTLGCTNEVSGPIAIPSIGFEIYSY